MRFDVVTIFPAMVQQALGAGIVGRAIERKTLSVVLHDLRDFTTDKHRVVDDVPYGGGPGMVPHQVRNGEHIATCPLKLVHCVGRPHKVFQVHRE